MSLVIHEKVTTLILKRQIFGRHLPTEAGKRELRSLSRVLLKMGINLELEGTRRIA